MKPEIKPYLVPVAAFFLYKMTQQKLFSDEFDGILFRRDFLSIDEYNEFPKITDGELFEKRLLDAREELSEKEFHDFIATFHCLPYYILEDDEKEKLKQIMDVLFTTNHFRKP
ncbi:MAG: hypothetical protein KBD48_02030 [Candidatus Pacebacteria bacterium]|nr:hypothetical protein [Candidatus Paceibacterota bacterium]MBP9715944.1 hypothetical protein [Candidatus Paceibacterota bacterium]